MSRPTVVPADHALHARLMDRDEKALAELFDRLGEWLFSLALSITGDPADAEEVVEDIFILLWDSPETFDPDRGSLRSFLAVATRHRCWDRRRSSGRRAAAMERAARSEAGLPISHMGTMGPDPYRNIERTEVSAVVRECLAALPRIQRETLELAYFAGMTQREIAESTDTPLGTVKTRIRDGMARLRQELSARRMGVNDE